MSNQSQFFIKSLRFIHAGIGSAHQSKQIFEIYIKGIFEIHTKGIFEIYIKGIFEIYIKGTTYFQVTLHAKMEMSLKALFDKV